MKALRIIVSILLIGFAFYVLQCSGSRTVASDRPEWADKGGGFYTADWGKAFYGVGAASNINNVGLRRNAADTQARADLARNFSTRIEDLIKIYAKSVSGGVENAVSEEQLAQQATRAFTDMDLSGAIIVDRYYDSVEKVQYSLTKLDMNMFKNQIDKMKELSQEVKNLIEKNAETAFGELDERVAKEKK